MNKELKWVRSGEELFKDYGDGFKGIISNNGCGYITRLCFNDKLVDLPKLSASLKSAKNMVDRKHKLEVERG